MRIGLYNVDSKIPNLAIMKLSAFHKAQGDHVVWYSPLFHNEYDKIYASKVFTFSDNGYLKNNMIIGGSGIDLHSLLPEEIEHIYPDYSLYPECDYSMGFLTRGCIRDCKFCIVPRKEGNIRKNADLEEFCKDQEKVLLLDNNFLAYSYHLTELEKLIASGKRIDFNQGLDIRLVNKGNAKLLRQLKRWKGLRYRFALDDHNLISLVSKKLGILNNAGITNGSMMFYVLIGFNSTKEDDLKRINFLKEKGCAIYAMPYKKTEYNNKFARWVNRYFYKYETFTDYLRGVRA